MNRLIAIGAAALLLTSCALWHASPKLDVNNAPETRIAALPGVDPADADRIVANRPYWKRQDLVDRGVLTARQYRQVEPLVYVGPPAMPEYLRPVPPVTW